LGERYPNHSYNGVCFIPHWQCYGRSCVHRLRARPNGTRRIIFQIAGENGFASNERLSRHAFA
jgi:hypothetical protein